MSTTIVTATGAALGPLLVFITWMFTKRHKEEIEDTASISDAVGAITDANVNIATIFSTMLAPMQNELARMAEVEKRQAEELARMAEVEQRQAEDMEAMRNELTSLQMRFTSIIRYVNILRRQVSDSGMEPAPIPSDLDLSGFNFD